jgi:fluoride ion exporter CrcB/FEX
VAFRYFVNANGVAQEVAWLPGVLSGFSTFSTFNSMFSTSGVAGFEVIFHRQYVGGIDSLVP